MTKSLNKEEAAEKPFLYCMVTLLRQAVLKTLLRWEINYSDAKHGSHKFPFVDMWSNHQGHCSVQACSCGFTMRLCKIISVPAAVAYSEPTVLCGKICRSFWYNAAPLIAGFCQPQTTEVISRLYFGGRSLIRPLVNSSNFVALLQSN